MNSSLWKFLRWTFGVVFGLAFGVLFAYGSTWSSGASMPLVMQVCAWIIFVPLGVALGVCIVRVME